MLVLAALTLVACGDDDDDNGGEEAAAVEEFPAGTTMAELQDAGEITIGVKAGSSLSPRGFLRSIGMNGGRRWHGTIDLILSTMTITEERDLEIDFSTPYYVANGDVLVPEGSEITGLEELGGQRTCTALGSPIRRRSRRRRCRRPT